VLVAPPGVEGGKYRCLDKITWHNVAFPEQALKVEKLLLAYNITHLEVDVTGPGGRGIADLLKPKFPALVEVTYSPTVKARMVAKALNIMANGRLEYDAGWKELTLSLMQIRRTNTAGGGQITYTSGRSEETGHADLAWALLHALDRSEITAGGDASSHQSIVEIF
jgi:hypothetical protein